MMCNFTSRALRLTVVFLGCCENATVTVTCKTPGELVPNIENCRKYFKCSNGDPSLQSCPGNQVYDLASRNELVFFQELSYLIQF